MFGFTLFLIAIIIVCMMFVTHLLFILKSFLPPQIGLYLDLQNRRKSAIGAPLIYIQWFFLIITLAFVLFFFLLGFLWLIIASVINPSIYLIYSSIILTFMTYSAYTYMEVERSYEETYNKIRWLFDDLFFKKS
jgi:hypothetical protein